MVPGFPYAGTWYDYLTGEEIGVSDLTNAWYLEPGEFRILLDTPLPVPDLDPNTPLQIYTGCTDSEAANYDPQATADDGSCSYWVTFSVDLGAVNPTAEGVHLAGEFQGWNPGSTPLNLNEEGIWETEVMLTPGQTYTYKFINGNEWGLDEGVPEACGIPNGLGSFNRFWDFDTTTTSHPELVCWSSCDPCGTEEIGSSYCGPGTVWDDALQLCVGISDENSCAEDITGDGLIAVDDLLALLSAFAESCSE